MAAGGVVVKVFIYRPDFKGAYRPDFKGAIMVCTIHVVHQDTFYSLIAIW
jgi:hypothetical protein